MKFDAFDFLQREYFETVAEINGAVEVFVNWRALFLKLLVKLTNICRSLLAFLIIII